MDQGNTVVIASGDAYAAAPEKKSRKKLIVLIAGVAIFVAIAVVVVILITRNSGASRAVNLRTIFDQSAPIPVDFGEQSFGYVSPEDGDVLIEAGFVYAERFYGDYAKVATEDRRGSKYKVINRKGEVVVDTDSGDAQGVQYIIDQDLWKIGAAFYDGKLNRITAEGVEGEYLGYGYIKVNASTDEGGDKVLNRTGKEVFVCTSSPCSVAIGSDFNNNGEFYAVVGYADRTSALVSLQDGKEIVRLGADASQYFSIIGNNLFAVERAGDGAVQRQFLVYGNEIKREFDVDVSLGVLTGRDVVVVTDASFDSEYYDVNDNVIYSAAEKSYGGNKPYSFSDLTVNYCADASQYGLMKKSDEILSCSYDNIVTLPENVFEYYSREKKQDLVLLFGDDVRLFDANKKEAVKVFGDSGAISDVQFFENSPFYMIDHERVYSLTDLSSSGVDISGYSSIECFGNYFVVDGATVYGLDLNIVEVAS